MTRAEHEYPNRVEIKGGEFVIQEGTSGDVGVNSGKGAARCLRARAAVGSRVFLS